MKGLNKLALATAVAAAPFAAQAELTAMSDQAMGDTTGQAGVTIELSTQVSMDQIEYSQSTDTDATGSLLVNNLSIGGMDSGGPFGEGLDVAINVDLPSGAAEEDSLTDFGSKAGTPLGGDDLTLNDGDALISVQSYQVDGDGDSVPVDMNLNIGGTDNNALQLESSDGDSSATLVSSIDMDVFLSQLDIIARTDNVVGGDSSSGSLEIEAGFAIDNLDAEFDVAAVGLEGMRMAGAGSLSILKGAGQGNGDVLGGGAAVVSMDIGQGEALSGTDTANGETLRVNLDNFQADVWMPTINVGGGDGTTASIGSVGISNLQVSNTEMAIYGRE
ncbi:hypothetical protein CK501_05335 [Halovibrio salipaludis]|uniref:DUF6160 domain-containing protein n=1 Tax=Halovibrio salipaludis TaxID=2032626 RepID=A0A2A2F8I6_9GAMM|nr:DUF6160 family protein [Halovibrio salipaludis]PAU80987.1 hypothetical protein CK501_05335 [Halovibrio salipaludis]